MPKYKRFSSTCRIQDVSRQTFKRQQMRLRNNPDLVWDSGRLRTLNYNYPLDTAVDRDKHNLVHLSSQSSSSNMVDPINDASQFAIFSQEQHSIDQLLFGVDDNAARENSTRLVNEISVGKICESVDPDPCASAVERIDQIQMVHDEATIWDEELAVEFFSDEEREELRMMRDRVFAVKDLNDFMTSNLFSQKCVTPVVRTHGEIFLMALKFCVSSKLCFQRLTQEFQLVNSIFEDKILPDSKYLLDKLLNPKVNMNFHGICPDCNLYLGEITESNSVIRCEECLLEVNLSHPSCLNVFITCDPSESIKSLLEANGVYYDEFIRKRSSNGTISDINDGRSYIDFQNSLPESERYSYLSGLLNTDGASRFESSAWSAWPVYLQINELPPKVRMKRLITLGIWFGKGKPDMNAFLEPVISMLNRISSTGIQCTIKGAERCIKLYVNSACVDSQARAPMQGQKAGTGYYGCGWCLHPGEHSSGSMRYPILDYHPEMRTFEQTLRLMELATDPNKRPKEEDLQGVKNASQLLDLEKFQIPDGLILDYMHNTDIGVGKWITGVLLSFLSGRQKLEIDKILENFSVPHQLARLSRPLSTRLQWKAKEWENFTLYYSLPIFKHFLEKKYFDYWKLFVDSLYTALQTEIKADEVDEAERDLRKFIYETQENFGKRNMTSNMHQLSHLMDSVRKWGPAWAHSCFPFETANYHILKAIHCANGVNLQIARFINIQQSIITLEEKIYPSASPMLIELCDRLNSTRTKRNFRLKNITYLGIGRTIDRSLAQTHQMSLFASFTFNRVIKDGCLYASMDQKNRRSNNSYARLKNGTFIRIISFAVDTLTKKSLTSCNIVNVSGKLSKGIWKVVSIDEPISIVETVTIDTVCVFMNVLSKSYVATLPNLLHY